MLAQAAVHVIAAELRHHGEFRLPVQFEEQPAVLMGGIVHGGSVRRAEAV
jgi:hypothetical protein